MSDTSEEDRLWEFAFRPRTGHSILKPAWGVVIPNPDLYVVNELSRDS